MDPNVAIGVFSSKLDDWNQKEESKSSGQHSSHYSSKNYNQNDKKKTQVEIKSIFLSKAQVGTGVHLGELKKLQLGCQDLLHKIDLLEEALAVQTGVNHRSGTVTFLKGVIMEEEIF